MQLEADRHPSSLLGTRVRTTQKATDDKEWTPWANRERRWGVEGTVIGFHDSHGLCLDVRHIDGTVGYYDPAELEELPEEQKPTEPPPRLCTCQCHSNPNIIHCMPCCERCGEPF